MSIYKKLHQIQCKINGFGKDKRSGSDSFGYEYVSGAKVLEFIRPLMNELGLILKQEILSIENDRQDYTTKATKWENINGQNTKVEYQKPKAEILSKVMMRFTWVDVETGEKDENLFGANGQNEWEKGLGSALTYAERYFFLKFFHIPTDEDDIDNELRKKVDDEKPQNTSPAQTPENKPANTPAQQNKTLPYLNENDENWKNMEAAIKAGEKKPSLAAIQKKYRLANKTVELLKTKFQIQ
ncbi:MULTISPECIES: ERF family protein [Chryseobacterium]|uniref:ERF superfamily protein n=1 Tax=Chryseobacterium gambrini TaxID=373672 RepID=A0A1N7LG74_9FLAO|nr:MULTISPECIES: ERF family protein [Chryseobacterium]SIS72817.1 ERF superfamily protein [Chryseobacterium gambrini]